MVGAEAGAGATGEVLGQGVGRWGKLQGGFQDHAWSCRYLREELAKERKLCKTTQKIAMGKWKKSE